MQIKLVQLDNWKGISRSINGIGARSLFVGPHGSGKTAILTAIEFALTGEVRLPDDRCMKSSDYIAKFAGPSDGGTVLCGVSLVLELDSGQPFTIKREMFGYADSPKQRVSINSQSMTPAAAAQRIATVANIVDAEAIMRMNPTELRAYLCGVCGIEGDDPMPALREKHGDVLPTTDTGLPWTDQLMGALGNVQQDAKDAATNRKRAEQALASSPVSQTHSAGGVKEAERLNSEAAKAIADIDSRLAVYERDCERRQEAERDLAQERKGLAALVDVEVPRAPEVSASALRRKADDARTEYNRQLREYDQAIVKLQDLSQRSNQLHKQVVVESTSPINRAASEIDKGLGLLPEGEGSRESTRHFRKAADILRDAKPQDSSPALVLTQKKLDAAEKGCPEKPVANDGQELERQAKEAAAAQRSHEDATETNRKNAQHRKTTEEAIRRMESALAQEAAAKPVDEEIEAARTRAKEASEQLASAHVAAQHADARDQLTTKIREYKETEERCRTAAKEMQEQLDFRLRDSLMPFTENVTSSMQLLLQGATVLAESKTERGRLVMSFLTQDGKRRVDYDTLSGAERRLFWMGVAISHAQLANVPGPILLGAMRDFNANTLMAAMEWLTQQNLLCVLDSHVLRTKEDMPRDLPRGWNAFVL